MLFVLGAVSVRADDVPLDFDRMPEALLYVQSKQDVAARTGRVDRDTALLAGSSVRRSGVELPLDAASIKLEVQPGVRLRLTGFDLDLMWAPFPPPPSPPPPSPPLAATSPPPQPRRPPPRIVPGTGSLGGVIDWRPTTGSYAPPGYIPGYGYGRNDSEHGVSVAPPLAPTGQYGGNIISGGGEDGVVPGHTPPVYGSLTTPPSGPLPPLPAPAPDVPPPAVPPPLSPPPLARRQRSLLRRRAAEADASPPPPPGLPPPPPPPPDLSALLLPQLPGVRLQSGAAVHVSYSTMRVRCSVLRSLWEAQQASQPGPANATDDANFVRFAFPRAHIRAWTRGALTAQELALTCESSEDFDAAACDVARSAAPSTPWEAADGDELLSALAAISLTQAPDCSSPTSHVITLPAGAVVSLPDSLTSTRAASSDSAAPASSPPPLLILQSITLRAGSLPPAPATDPAAPPGPPDAPLPDAPFAALDLGFVPALLAVRGGASVRLENLTVLGLVRHPLSYMAASLDAFQATRRSPSWPPPPGPQALHLSGCALLLPSHEVRALTHWAALLTTAGGAAASAAAGDALLGWRSALAQRMAGPEFGPGRLRLRSGLLLGLSAADTTFTDNATSALEGVAAAAAAAGADAAPLAPSAAAANDTGGSAAAAALVALVDPRAREPPPPTLLLAAATEAELMAAAALPAAALTAMAAATGILSLNAPPVLLLQLTANLTLRRPRWPVGGATLALPTTLQPYPPDAARLIDWGLGSAFFSPGRAAATAAAAAAGGAVAGAAALTLRGLSLVRSGWLLNITGDPAFPAPPPPAPPPPPGGEGVLVSTASLSDDVSIPSGSTSDSTPGSSPGTTSITSFDGFNLAALTEGAVAAAAGLPPPPPRPPGPPPAPLLVAPLKAEFLQLQTWALAPSRAAYANASLPAAQLPSLSLEGCSLTLSREEVLVVIACAVRAGAPLPLEPDDDPLTGGYNSSRALEAEAAASTLAAWRDAVDEAASLLSGGVCGGLEDMGFKAPAWPQPWGWRALPTGDVAVVAAAGAVAGVRTSTALGGTAAVGGMGSVRLVDPLLTSTLGVVRTDMQKLLVTAPTIDGNTSRNTTPTADSGTATDGGGEGLSGGAIAGIVIGSVLAAAVLAAAAFFVLSRRSQNKSTSRKSLSASDKSLSDDSALLKGMSPRNQAALGYVLATALASKSSAAAGGAALTAAELAGGVGTPGVVTPRRSGIGTGGSGDGSGPLLGGGADGGGEHAAEVGMAMAAGGDVEAPAAAAGGGGSRFAAGGSGRSRSGSGLAELEAAATAAKFRARGRSVTGVDRGTVGAGAGKASRRPTYAGDGEMQHVGSPRRSKSGGPLPPLATPPGPNSGNMAGDPSTPRGSKGAAARGSLSWLSRVMDRLRAGEPLDSGSLVRGGAVGGSTAAPSPYVTPITIGAQAGPAYRHTIAGSASAGGGNSPARTASREASAAAAAAGRMGDFQANDKSSTAVGAVALVRRYSDHNGGGGGGRPPAGPLAAALEEDEGSSGTEEDDDYGDEEQGDVGGGGGRPGGAPAAPSAFAALSGAVANKVAAKSGTGRTQSAVLDELHNLSVDLSSEIDDNQLLVLDVVASGGYGTVYRGTWQGLSVAVKTILFQESSYSRRVALQEAALSKSISHPNIVATYAVDARPIGVLPSRGSRPTITLGGGDVGAFTAKTTTTSNTASSASTGERSMADIRDWRLYIIQEYCDGGTLLRALKGRFFVNTDTGLGGSPSQSVHRVPYGTAHGGAGEDRDRDQSRDSSGHVMGMHGMARMCSGRTVEGGPNLHMVLELALGIAAALRHLHSKQVVHGDLNPRNVLLKRDGATLSGYVPKVADFGMSVRMSASQSHVSNVWQGTQFYAAPEQTDHGILTKFSDAYAFGVMLWELAWSQPVWVAVEPPPLPPGVRPPHPAAQRPVQYVAHPDFPHLPPSVPHEYAALVAACLRNHHTQRPTFSVIYRSLRAMQAQLRAALHARLCPELEPLDSPHTSVASHTSASVGGGGVILPGGASRASSIATQASYAAAANAAAAAAAVGGGRPGSAVGVPGGAANAAMPVRRSVGGVVVATAAPPLVVGSPRGDLPAAVSPAGGPAGGGVVVGPPPAGGGGGGGGVVAGVSPSPHSPLGVAQMVLARHYQHMQEAQQAAMARGGGTAGKGGGGGAGGGLAAMRRSSSARAWTGGAASQLPGAPPVAGPAVAAAPVGGDAAAAAAMATAVAVAAAVEQSAAAAGGGAGRVGGGVAGAPNAVPGVYGGFGYGSGFTSGASSANSNARPVLLRKSASTNSAASASVAAAAVAAAAAAAAAGGGRDGSTQGYLYPYPYPHPSNHPLAPSHDGSDSPFTGGGVSMSGGSGLSGAPHNLFSSTAGYAGAANLTAGMGGTPPTGTAPGTDRDSNLTDRASSASGGSRGSAPSASLSQMWSPAVGGPMGGGGGGMGGPSAGPSPGQGLEAGAPPGAAGVEQGGGGGGGNGRGGGGLGGLGGGLGLVGVSPGLPRLEEGDEAESHSTPATAAKDAFAAAVTPPPPPPPPRMSRSGSGRRPTRMAPGSGNLAGGSGGGATPSPLSGSRRAADGATDGAAADAGAAAAAVVTGSGGGSIRLELGPEGERLAAAAAAGDADGAEASGGSGRSGRRERRLSVPAGTSDLMDAAAGPDNAAAAAAADAFRERRSASGTRGIIAAAGRRHQSPAQARGRGSSLLFRVFNRAPTGPAATQQLPPPPPGYSPPLPPRRGATSATGAADGYVSAGGDGEAVSPVADDRLNGRRGRMSYAGTGGGGNGPPPAPSAGQLAAVAAELVPSHPGSHSHSHTPSHSIPNSLQSPSGRPSRHGSFFGSFASSVRSASSNLQAGFSRAGSIIRTASHVTASTASASAGTTASGAAHRQGSHAGAPVSPLGARAPAGPWPLWRLGSRERGDGAGGGPVSGGPTSGVPSTPGAAASTAAAVGSGGGMGRRSLHLPPLQLGDDSNGAGHAGEPPERHTAPPGPSAAATPLAAATSPFADATAAAVQAQRRVSAPLIREAFTRELQRLLTTSRRVVAAAGAAATAGWSSPSNPNRRNLLVATPPTLRPQQSANAAAGLGAALGANSPAASPRAPFPLAAPPAAAGEGGSGAAGGGTAPLRFIRGRGSAKY